MHELFDVVISVLSEYEYDDYMIEAADFGPTQVWHRLVAEDDEDFDITTYFDRTHAIICQALKEQKRVLVHCAAGISRSATLVAAFLRKEFDLDAQKAIEQIEKRRSCIDPNDGFRRQLFQWTVVARN